MDAEALVYWCAFGAIYRLYAKALVGEKMTMTDNTDNPATVRVVIEHPWPVSWAMQSKSILAMIIAWPIMRFVPTRYWVKITAYGKEAVK